MSNLELNQTGLSLPIKVVKVGEPPYHGDGWDTSQPYYLVDGADGTVLCGVAEAFKKAFEYMAQCTNSDSAVVDAEKLGIIISSAGFMKYERSPDDRLTATEVTTLVREEKRELAQLITDNIDLKLDWVDGKAEWGDFELYISDSKTAFHKKYWHLYLHTSQIQCIIRLGHIRGKRNAQQACESALKRILTGQKE